MEAIGKILMYTAICCGLKIVLSRSHRLLMEALLVRMQCSKWQHDTAWHSCIKRSQSHHPFGPLCKTCAFRAKGWSQCTHLTKLAKPCEQQQCHHTAVVELPWSGCDLYIARDIDGWCSAEAGWPNCQCCKTILVVLVAKAADSRASSAQVPPGMQEQCQASGHWSHLMASSDAAPCQGPYCSGALGGQLILGGAFEVKRQWEVVCKDGWKLVICRITVSILK